ncbi:N-6 DNA methylase [Clostridium formicaceticum]|uniref:site-specific DNA-methyltransferase (adenine-specific) n=1 Tax=Clostridium formicaceticum TaxID=1497 RepID=A0AAC9RN41_9CLOT|nr:N-6 DNA methylase [Clostridium formicaceticum]AOY74703.1 hypothetical protein BJL90_01275 [Clostridium formicaceticum]ARE89081.1 N-6 DNA Methylase [Clostridium formicaceticum]
MRIEIKEKHEKVAKDLRTYLQNKGCSIIQEEVKTKNYIADMVGFTISEKGKLTPEVVVEITTTVNPNKQRQLFTISKQFGAKYALLVVLGEEEKKYWFDAVTSLPVEEPTFKSHSRYLLRNEDIENNLFKCFDILRGSLRPFEQIKLVLSMLLVRKYLLDIDNLEHWGNLGKESLTEVLYSASTYYALGKTDKIENISEKALHKLIAEMEQLPPVKEEYPNIFMGFVERLSSRDVGAYATTRKLNDIVTKLISTLNIRSGKAIDLAAGFGFQLFSAMKEVKVDEFIGIEINEEISELTNILRLIGGYVGSKIIVDDGLQIKNDNTYTLVSFEPPIGSVALGNKYIDFKITNEGKRRRIDYSELFIEKAIELAEGKGYIVAVVPEGILFSSSSELVRKLILDKTIVKAVISLPEHIKSPYTGIKLSILVLQKKANENEEGVEFFAGKIDSLEDVDEVAGAFKKWNVKEV